MTRKTGIRWSRIIDPVVAEGSGLAAADVSGIVQSCIPDAIVAGSGIAVEPVDSKLRVSSTVSIPQRVERLEGLIDGVETSSKGIVTIQVDLDSVTPGAEYTVYCGDPQHPGEATYTALENDTIIEVIRGLMQAMSEIIEMVDDNNIPLYTPSPWNQVDVWEDYSNTALLSQGQFRVMSSIDENSGYGFFTPYVDPVSSSITIVSSSIGQSKGIAITGNVNVSNGGLYGVTRIYDATNAVRLIEFREQAMISIGDQALEIGWPNGTIYSRGGYIAGGYISTSTQLRGRTIVLGGWETASVSGATNKINPDTGAWGSGLASFMEVTSTNSAVASGLSMNIHSQEGRIGIVRNMGPEDLTIDCGLPGIEIYDKVVTPSGNNITLTAGDSLLVVKNKWPEEWIPIGGSYHTNRANHYGAQLASTISDFNEAVTSSLEGGIYTPFVSGSGAWISFVDGYAEVQGENGVSLYSPVGTSYASVYGTVAEMVGGNVSTPGTIRISSSDNSAISIFTPSVSMIMSEDPDEAYGLNMFSNTRSTRIASGSSELEVTTSGVIVTGSITGKFMPAQMTTIVRDARTDMIEGEMVYTTDNHKMAYYNGSTWIEY